MHAQALLPLVALLPVTHAAETILGLYIFSRHGDRTDKSHSPTVLTDLGYQDVYTSGQYFREQYIAASATARIAGISSDVVNNAQLTAQAPDDLVLLNSAQGFLQGLYPPVGTSLGSQSLRNGTVAQSPLNGYQLIPVHLVESGAGSEDSAWLQGTTGCLKSTASSNEYFSTPEYLDLKAKTDGFYRSLSPIINGTFTEDQTSFKNAYAIFDVLNVASIHNKTINSSNLLTDEVLSQTRTLADQHEFNLAFNASEAVRAIAGATLAAQIVQQLNDTITTAGKKSVGIQFGAYGSFLSFFGLAQLTNANPQFFGIPDYASTMTFELFTTGPATPFPSADDVQVRFLFHNGTTSNISTPAPFPLFGQNQTTLPWSTFASEMDKFAVGTQEQWCSTCGNNTGMCAAAAAPSASNAAAPATSSSSDSGMSLPVAGVIGAMVTLAVLLGLEALFMLLAGFRLVRAPRASAASVGGVAPVVGQEDVDLDHKERASA
ncbi:MAG: hypothetical protein M1838_001154 [Thelocarpon superellum]|nr:MAG: hypothetical protein M1838_001154 [Thelocarpon superellum]